MGEEEKLRRGGGETNLYRNPDIFICPPVRDSSEARLQTAGWKKRCPKVSEDPSAEEYCFVYRALVKLLEITSWDIFQGSAKVKSGP